MNYPRVFVTFHNKLTEIESLSYTNDSFFMKAWRNEIGEQYDLVLESTYKLDPDVFEQLNVFMKKDISLYIERQVVGETEDDFQVSYVLTPSGLEYLDKINISVVKELLRVFDCLDIKPFLVVIMKYLMDKNFDYSQQSNYIKTNRMVIPKIVYA